MNTFKSWIGVSGTDPNYTIVMMSGGTGEAIDVDENDTIRGEAWFIGLDAQRDAVLKEYGNQLPSRRESLLEPEAGWNSWYQLWSGVDAEAVRGNAPLARQILADRLPQDTPKLRIVVDDGWQKAWGEWLPNEKFGEDYEASRR